MTTRKLVTIVAGDDQSCPDRACLQRRGQRRAITVVADYAKGAACVEAGNNLIGGDIVCLLQNAEGRLFDVEANGVTKQKKQHGGHKQNKGEAAWIAQQMPPFLTCDSAQALHFHGFGPCSASTATNVSSSSGGASSSLLIAMRC